MENIALIGIDFWVRTLAIFIVRIIVGRPFTVKKFTRPKLHRISGDMPTATTIAMEACWRFSLYGTHSWQS